jgi:UDP:flavonoid glycosyltransferase YjiC (YdhE family)
VSLTPPGALEETAMKILIAASPLTGHVNPLLAVGRAAAARGDTVLMLTDAAFRAKVEAAGLRFTPYPDDDAATFRATELPAGPERYRREFERRFIDPMPIQAATLRRLIAEEAPDVIVAGSMFLGVLPLLLDTAPRPPIVTVNVSFLFLERPDHAPIGLGLPPARDQEDRVRYAALKAGMDAAFANPVRAYTDAALARLGLPPIPASLPHSIVVLPDLFLQPTVPGFEYDYGALPPGVRFIGLLQPPAPPAPLPDWWPELEAANAAGKPVVLVTQGTLANADFGELVEPTLAALADRDDLLVLATTGGRPVETLRGPIPSNPDRRVPAVPRTAAAGERPGDQRRLRQRLAGARRRRADRLGRPHRGQGGGQRAHRVGRRGPQPRDQQPEPGGVAGCGDAGSGRARLP